jgi:RecA-family ATPase
MLVGRPFTGKTTLTASLAAAVASSQSEWLGRRVHGSGSVMVITTDPHEPEAWGSRMKGHKVPAGAVQVSECRQGDLPGLVGQVVEQRPALLVLDNLLGTIRGDVRDNSEAREVLNILDNAIAAGIAVLAIHHTSAKPFEDGRTMSKEPMGSTAFAAWTRQTVFLEPSAAGELKLHARGNECPAHEFSLGVEFSESGNATYRLVEARAAVDKRKRKEDTQEVRVALARRILGDPALAAMSQGGIAQKIGESKAAVQRALTAVGAEKAGGRWVGPSGAG